MGSRKGGKKKIGQCEVMNIGWNIFQGVLIVIVLYKIMCIVINLMMGLACVAGLSWITIRLIKDQESKINK